jgi:hypothetical protein
LILLLCDVQQPAGYTCRWVLWCRKHNDPGGYILINRCRSLVSISECSSSSSSNNLITFDESYCEAFAFRDPKLNVALNSPWELALVDLNIDRICLQASALEESSLASQLHACMLKVLTVLMIY